MRSEDDLQRQCFGIVRMRNISGDVQRGFSCYENPLTDNCFGFEITKRQF